VTTPPNLAHLVAADAATGGHSFGDDIAGLSDTALCSLDAQLSHMAFQVRRRAGERGLTLPSDDLADYEEVDEGNGWVVAIAAVWASVGGFLVVGSVLAGPEILGPHGEGWVFAHVCATVATYFIVKSRP
jgi:hypothetical protein